MKLLTSLYIFSLLAMSALAVDPIRHVVSFKFKKDADPAKVRKVEEEFAALKGKIPAIASLEWGTNVSPEKHDKGFTHCWIVSFKSAEDRDAYLVHPDHEAFANGLGGVIEDVFVLDFVPR